MVFPNLAHSLYDFEYFQFCGNTIAGISLLSSAVMRLVHTDNKELFADALIKRRSLYIMRYIQVFRSPEPFAQDELL